ncbi:PTS-EIIA-like component DhaM of the dihydroxyacetone kinase DhaKLM complex [Actinacidiphila yanglinensis]|uniref:PTS-EIIA-like component DhaM of the dihydroxyacetone kinase DhaKLM complex n=1 Tax=Actinacidiphila yanglinensis TaxID=310779 RepID=A0A1H6DXW3_9ACTN|nr:PTS fructose transporter subunit IIA [Actinacidiphila yanglinensis]SEG90128.1 PTS-EIIA-like component DhaM of the dihydroxyacetone kinase DhaKLM complex [Actinacidiphila yanglinensis]
MTAPAQGTGGDDAERLVGIVLVSHSAAAANAVADLAASLSGSAKVPLEPAGGGPDGGLGTSSDLIASAARTVDRGAGIAVLADIGSAVLTVKALLADDELPAGARLIDAPFLEGAVAAVVTASTGADIDAVAAAAGEAYIYRKV